MANPGSLSAAGFMHDAMFTELWKACAGPLVDVPRSGQKVYYFPQGHLEQLTACTNEELDQRVNLFNLPSKILCRVQTIKLMAEQDTDEVYVKITLVPEKDQNEPPQLPEMYPPEPARPMVRTLCKVLTQSDTNPRGGLCLSVPRRHAHVCLPPLDMNRKVPIQHLVTKDLHDTEWQFKHIYRGHPKRHLLSTGWSTFIASKRLVAGNTFLLLRSETGEIRVGFRRISRKQISMPTSVISTRSMYLGLLADAAYALLSQSPFVVYYKPRICQFIVRLDKYLESVNNVFNVGSYFKMRFEEEDSEIRFRGTIVGAKDFSSDWPNSKWRSLKVQWHESIDMTRPEWVSPWEIEPDLSAANVGINEPTLIIPKRPRSPDNGVHGSRPGIAPAIWNRYSLNNVNSSSSNDPNCSELPCYLTTNKKSNQHIKVDAKKDKRKRCLLFDFDMNSSPKMDR